MTVLALVVFIPRPDRGGQIGMFNRSGGALRSIGKRARPRDGGLVLVVVRDFHVDVLSNHAASSLSTVIGRLRRRLPVA